MNSISDIGNRLAAIQFRSRRPTLDTIEEEMLIENEEVSAPSREKRFPTQMPPSILSRRPLVRTTNQDINLPTLLLSAQSPPVDEFNLSENRGIGLSTTLPSAFRERQQETQQARLRLEQAFLARLSPALKKALRTPLSPAEQEVGLARLRLGQQQAFLARLSPALQEALQTPLSPAQQEAGLARLRLAQQQSGSFEPALQEWEAINTIKGNVRQGTPDSAMDLN